jgi:peptidoglycan/LPS O-acetylase OafA/YrhL
MQRIVALDGFRALAVSLVIMYHYFSSWVPPKRDLYPYGALLNDFYLAKYGYLGVQFFFMISGFVISMTLLDCRTWQEFALKRFARLWPAMLLCSVLTFVFVNVGPLRIFESSWRDFIPSLTFLHPRIVDSVLSMDGSRWIDIVYWSLFVEVTFYFLAASLFFAFRSRFPLAVIGLLGLAAITELLSPGNAFTTHLLIAPFLPWFVAGIGFQQIYTRTAPRIGVAMVVMSAAYILGLRPELRAHTAELPLIAGMFALFFVLTHRPSWVSAFAWRPIADLGAASYSLYLIHHVIGVTLIAWLAKALAVSGLESLFIAIAVAAAMALLATAIYRLWEIPSRRLILAWGRRPSAREVLPDQGCPLRSATGSSRSS